MKKTISLLLAVLLLVTALGGLTAYAATGSLTATASQSSVTIGSTVSITLKYDGGGAKIASIEPQISYNAKAFEYVSCEGATASGGAGIVRISYYASSATPPTSVTFTLKFKAIAAGSGDFAVTTSEFYNDDDYSTLGTPSKTLAVAAINPTKSANANLASIRPSSGTLTPAFKPEVTNYTISVPYTTTSLSLSVTTQDREAKTAVSGSNKLSVGKNTQTITVTAPNGTTKKYTVVISRSANQTTAKPDQPTTTQPQEDPLEVSVDGVLMTVSDTQPTEELPESFAWTHITINDVAVSAAVNETLGITLVHLTRTLDDSAAFYIYNETQGLFYAFCPLTVQGGEYVLLAMPSTIDAPAGTVAGTHNFGTVARDVFVFEDAALDSVCLVYATSPAGKTGLYMYDAEDGSMQLYREITVAADATPTQPTQPAAGGFSSFITQNRTVILICAAAAGGLALLIAAVILLASITRRDKNCKH